MPPSSLPAAAPSPPSQERPAIITARGLNFTVSTAGGQVGILRDIDLTVAEGEAVAILGPSGSGKSSLMLLLAGLERADRGYLSVAGTELAGLEEDALARFRRRSLGIVFQAFHLIPGMTALENAAVPLELAGIADAFPRARHALEQVGLSHRLNHYPAQLSGGEQQRVAIARAFAVNPRLLLADEPTGNLDRRTGQQVMDLLFSMRARHGTTLVLITHDAALARRCDRQVLLEDGRILAGGQPPAAVEP